MESFQNVTNNMSPVPQVQPTPIPMNTGFTPFIVTTDATGVQYLSPMPCNGPMPFVLPPLPPMLSFDSNGSPTPMAPVFFTPSPSPLPMVAQSLPATLPQAGLLPLPMMTMSNDLLSASTSNSVDRFACSVSRERDVIGDVVPFESERPLEPVTNEKNIPVPTLTNDMTKKDLVNATLDWFYEVLGSERFDCEGRRGENVLRIKVKTRGALSYICPLVNQLLEENLLHKLSCPISKKRQRRYVRGYLAYLEANSEEAALRMLEIFNEMNQVYVMNSEGEMEHPFKGISRNPIPIRPHVPAPMHQNLLAA